MLGALFNAAAAFHTMVNEEGEVEDVDDEEETGNDDDDDCDDWGFADSVTAPQLAFILGESLASVNGDCAVDSSGFR